MHLCRNIIVLFINKGRNTLVLFLSLLGVVLIILQLSYRRSIITAVILLLLSMTDIPIFGFLITLYDLRQIKNTNIFITIIYFFVLNIISYSCYLINNKLKGGSYEYSFYENYIFLVTRLGGQRVFKSKLFVKAIFEAFCLILSTYIFTMLFLYLFYS